MSVESRLFQVGSPHASQIKTLNCTPKALAEMLSSQYPQPAQIVIGTEKAARVFNLHYSLKQLIVGRNPAEVKFYLDDRHFASIEVFDYGTGVVKLAWAIDREPKYAKITEIAFSFILRFIEPFFNEPLQQTQNETGQPEKTEKTESAIVRLKLKPRWTKQDWLDVFTETTRDGSRPDYYELQHLTGKTYNTIKEMYSRLFNRD